MSKIVKALLIFANDKDKTYTGSRALILCALGEVVLNEHPSDKSFEVVAEFYNVDQDLLEVEQGMY